MYLQLRLLQLPIRMTPSRHCPQLLQEKEIVTSPAKNRNKLNKNRIKQLKRWIMSPIKKPSKPFQASKMLTLLLKRYKINVLLFNLSQVSNFLLYY